MEKSREFTPRQRNEIAHHVRHAARPAEELQPLSYGVIQHRGRKWRNHYWAAYSILARAGVRGCAVLVPGCGNGQDAMRCAKTAANVTAIDLSPDMLQVAAASAAREGVFVKLDCMPAEKLMFVDSTVD
jgi:2-polyprenyl-3-methyl-5-hydroxy-6-metoxy-1,4-benzoquinol methylase